MKLKVGLVGEIQGSKLECHTDYTDRIERGFFVTEVSMVSCFDGF